MNDPEGAHDTEPSGAPAASTEPGADNDPSGGDITEPGPPREEVEANPGDGDSTEDFFRWLPTMWLWHRRRRELVERRSSDGADFATYASAGRPARAAVRAEAKDTVEVQPRRGRPFAVGDRPGSIEASERDAPTVSIRKRKSVLGRTGMLVGSVVVAVVSAALGIGSRLHWPRASDESTPLPPAATVLAQALGPPAAPTESMALAPSRARESAPPLEIRAPETKTSTRAMGGAPTMKESGRKMDGPGAAGRRVDSSVVGRAMSSATPPSKDQYFEEP
jgi:hypothetical protein